MHNDNLDSTSALNEDNDKETVEDKEINPPDFKIREVLSEIMQTFREVAPPEPKVDECNVVSEDFSEDQNKIIGFLQFLSKDFHSKDEIEDYLNENIVSLYLNKNFRHSYFEISAYLQSTRPQIDNEDIQEQNPINENLKILKNEVTISDANVRRKIFKFIDHCNLELSRFSYFEKAYWKTKNAKNEFDRIQVEYDKLNKKRKTIDKRVTELKEELSSSKSEYITILSILAALILAGVGGFSLLGNISGAVKDLSNYRFLFVLSSFGFILFNISIAMIYLIARLVKRDLYTVCSDSDGGDCLKGSCKKNCCSLVKMEKRFPFLFWFNFIDILILVLSMSMEYIVMKYPMVEWVSILLAFLFIGLSVYYGIKNSKV